MGWTTCYNAKNWKWEKGRRVVDRKAECDNELTWENRDKETGALLNTCKVLKSSMVGRVYYAAVEVVNCATGKRSVSAAVWLTCGRSNDGTVWGYKDMDETVGPYYYDCPASILAILSETENETANEWRRLCRERAEEKRAKRAEKLAAEKDEMKIAPPIGVTVKRSGRMGWVVTSAEYRQRYNTSGGSLFRRMSYNNALSLFVACFGTQEEKDEWERNKAAAKTA